MYTFPVTVYVEDTDYGAVVYHANYIKFMGRARNELLQAIGYELRTLAEQDLFFVVTNIDIDYKKPARLGDKLVVHSRLLEHSRITLTFQQTITATEDSNTIFTNAKVTLALINGQGRPQRLPQDFLSKIT